MVGIVDYGMGNLLSVYNAIDWIGADVECLQNLVGQGINDDDLVGIFGPFVFEIDRAPKAALGWLQAGIYVTTRRDKTENADDVKNLAASFSHLKSAIECFKSKASFSDRKRPARV